MPDSGPQKMLPGDWPRYGEEQKREDVVDESTDTAPNHPYLPGMESLPPTTA